MLEARGAETAIIIIIILGYIFVSSLSLSVRGLRMTKNMLTRSLNSLVQTNKKQTSSM